MVRKSKISYEIKIQVVEEYLEGNCSLRSVARKLGVNIVSFSIANAHHYIR